MERVIRPARRIGVATAHAPTSSIRRAKHGGSALRTTGGDRGLVVCRPLRSTWPP
jgi:hypothetical protein